MVFARWQQAVALRHLLGEFQHLVKAPACLDRSGHGQLVVGLDPEASRAGRLRPDQGLGLRTGQRQQR